MDHGTAFRPGRFEDGRNLTEAQDATGFAAQTDPSRLAILRHLVRAGPDGLAAGAIAGALGASPSRVSFHLARLSRSGLVTSRRQARQVRYAAATAELGALVGWPVEDRCAGSEALRGCCR